MGWKKGKRVWRVGNNSTVDAANDAVRNDSSVDAVNNVGNVNSQRIQKTDADVSNRDSINLDLSQDDNNATRTICGREHDFCWAVNEAHGAQLAAEAIEMRKGYPLAEFEKFIRSASPVICPFVQGGQGAPLSRGEIPNISLWNLWQWFEKHGNYGLEVKVEECTTRHLKFSAYFNPSLSAIQLFKDNRTQGSPTGDFQIGFSLLVPNLRVENSSSSRKENVVSYSRASSDCSAADPPVESNLSDELLFEYFEQETPQNRKPFFEKCVVHHKLFLLSF